MTHPDRRRRGRAIRKQRRIMRRWVLVGEEFNKGLLKLGVEMGKASAALALLAVADEQSISGRVDP